jgi:hypothetical protein
MVLFRVRPVSCSKRWKRLENISGGKEEGTGSLEKGLKFGVFAVVHEIL